ncbi:hypothetical protein [Paraburkholderia sp. XV]|uniref:hypothetical protein n=1 Tax=Paraburkholderia sp. XV TaxID=2831520 RepID=UPI001CD73450|nr:hypothetical protein [Paraburkholderia sp. XV]
MSKSRTLPSRQRSNVIRAYRSRGKTNRDLTLVYSLKTNRDWIIRSGRHLVHWAIFLETNPEVRTFNLDLDDASIGGAEKKRGLDFDAEVELASGASEYHKLLFGENASDSCAQTDVLSNAGQKTVRTFVETDFSGRGEEAMRWMKVLAYCAAIRDEQQTEASQVAITVMRGLSHGVILDVTESMHDFDSQIALGVISRMAVLGDIGLDLSSSGFTLSSTWVWRADQ